MSNSTENTQKKGGSGAAANSTNAAATSAALKDHEIAALVSQVRDVAITFAGAQQLRERIANILVPALRLTPPSADDAADAAFDAVRLRLCKLQKYSFHIDSRGNLRRVSDDSGNWIEFDAAHALFDPIAVDAAIAASKETT